MLIQCPFERSLSNPICYIVPDQSLLTVKFPKKGKFTNTAGNLQVNQRRNLKIFAIVLYDIRPMNKQPFFRTGDFGVLRDLKELMSLAPLINVTPDRYQAAKVENLDL